MYDDYENLIERLRECTAEQNGEKTLWCQAADAIDDLVYICKHLSEELRNVTKWIPVTERLPEDIDDVLVTDGKAFAVGYWRHDAKAWDSTGFGWIENRTEPPYGINTVAYWMPLPEPPKDGA